MARHENEIGGTTDVAAHPEFAARRTTRLIDGSTVSGWFTEDFTLAELKTLRARERIPDIRPANARFDGQFEIPTLEEILALVRGAGLQRAARAAQLRAAAPAPIGIYPRPSTRATSPTWGSRWRRRCSKCLSAAGHAGRTAPVWLQSFEVGNLKALSRMTELPLVQLIEAAGRTRSTGRRQVCRGVPPTC